MKQRLKWLCVGVGVMFGMQLIILLIVHNLIPVAAPPGFSSLLATIVYTLVAFMAGGFVIGLMAERIEIVEPVAATVVTLAIDVLTTLAGGLSGMFLFSLAFRQGDYWVAFAIGGVAIVAALAGALAGERLEAPVESWINQALMIVGLAGLVLGPYLVISVCYEHTARRDHRLRGTTAWRDLVGLASLSQTGRGRRSDVDSA